jgi:hypothetical protein
VHSGRWHRAVLPTLGATILLLGGCGGSSSTARVASQRADQARRAAADAGLPRDVQDLLARAAGAAAKRFTVTYRTGDGSTAVLTQRPPRRRVDLQVGDVTRTLIDREDGSWSCLLADKQWKCQKATSTPVELSPFSAGDVERTVDQLAASRATYTFRVEHRRVADTAATCLVTTLRPDAPHDATQAPLGELCLSPEGAPLVSRGGTEELVATRYRTSAPASAFTLPAKP